MRRKDTLVLAILALTGFSVGDELGFPQALSTTEDQDKRRSTNENDILRAAAMSSGRSHSGRSPQLSSWGMTGLPGTAGAVPGTAGVVPPFKPLAGVGKEAAVPPFSALPPSIARIPVISGRPQAPVQPPPPILQASLQQMANRRYQVSPPAGNDMPMKNSIVVGSVEPASLPSRSGSQSMSGSLPMSGSLSMMDSLPMSDSLPMAPPPPRPKPRPDSYASKTKRLQDALHHPTADTASPSPLLMGHSVESLAKASNISAEVIAAALRLREQQLIASLTSTAPTTTTTTTTTTTPRPTKPATVRPRYPLIGPNRVMNAPKEYYPVSYDQNYDDNFTSKVELPDTSFSCGDQKHFPGLYADEDLGCMVFHVCAFTDDGMVMKSFLCPESTLFDQSILKCNWWFYVDCKASKRLYDSNIPISKSYQLMKALAFFSAYKNQTSNNT